MIRPLLRQLAILLLLTATAFAANDPLAGTWKLNPAKSRLVDQMKVEAAGPNRYTFIFSGDNTETIVAGGTDQPGLFGTTFAVTVLSPKQWKVVRKMAGRVMISAIWDLSADGNKLTDHFTGYRADGSTSDLLYVYARTAGESGFSGTWESVEEHVNSTYQMEVQSSDGKGLSFINAAQKMTKRVTFDNQEVPVEGPNAPAGYTTSGTRLSDRAIQLTDKVKGKVLDTQQVEISPDGNSLTITTHIPGQKQPNIQVFDRQ